MGFVIFIVLAALFIYVAIKSSKKAKKNYEDFIQENGVTITKKSNKFKDGKTIIYDDKKKLLWIFQPFVKTQIGFPVEKLSGCELTIDDETNFKASTASAAGRALVGGVLLGGVGAVIGGVTGKKKGNTVVKKIELIISTSDLENPYMKILVLNNSKGIKKDSILFKQPYDDAMYWCKFIEAVIKSYEKEAPLN